MLLITIKFKNNKTAFFYLAFIFSYLKTILKKINTINKKITKLTILKSPHVHKIGQQQYQQKIFKKKILFVSFDKIKLVFFLKKLINFIYQDINFNCYFICKNNKFKICLNYFKLYFIF